MTIDKVAEIELKSMTNAGIPEDIAKGWVVKGLQGLESQGVKELKNIPWNGVNY